MDYMILSKSLHLAGPPFPHPSNQGVGLQWQGPLWLQCSESQGRRVGATLLWLSPISTVASEIPDGRGIFFN